jgi:hypothetical protein
MLSTQNLNQFGQGAIKGNVDKSVNPNTLSVVLDPASNETYLVAGQPVKLVTSTGNGIIVDLAATNESIYGIVLANLKTSKFYPGESMEIGCQGTVVYLEASAAISRGALIEYVASGVKVKTNAGVNTITGLALDNASGNGQILRVQLSQTVVFSPTITGGSINSTPIGAGTPSTGAFTTLAASGAVVFAAAMTAKTVAGAIAVITSSASMSVDPTLGNVFTLTPGHTGNIAMASVPAAGQRIDLVITTSGASSFTLTFTTNFKTTGTLATGTATGKVFVMSFVSDGVNLNEVARTTAM